MLTDYFVEFSKNHEVKYCALRTKHSDPFIVERLSTIPAVTPGELLKWSDVILMDCAMNRRERWFFKPKWRKTIIYCPSVRPFGWLEKLFRRSLPPHILVASKYIGSSIRWPSQMICGIKTDHFKPLDTEKKYDVVIIGRMRPVKNHLLFLEICRQGNFSFLTIGGTQKWMTGHVNEIEQKVRAQAVDGRDYVTGVVKNEEVPIYLNQAKIALVTSHYEGLGFNSLEPMACGVPAVVRESGGTVEAVGADSDLVVPHDAPAEMYVAKISKYKDDVDLRKKVRLRVLEEFSYQKSLEDFERLFQKVAQGG